MFRAQAVESLSSLQAVLIAEAKIICRARRRTINPQTLKEQTTMIKNFLKDESGLELSEYAVAAALVAITVVGAFSALGDSISAKITELTGFINN